MRDVFLHALKQCIAGEWRALFVLEDPLRNLAVPDQVMAHDEHLVLLAEGHVPVGRIEVIASSGRGWIGSHFRTFSGLMVLNCAVTMAVSRASFSSKVAGLSAAPMRKMPLNASFNVAG